MDFMADPLFDGRKFRVLTLIDTFTRECLALNVGHSLKGADVVNALDNLLRTLQPPRMISSGEWN